MGDVGPLVLVVTTHAAVAGQRVGCNSNHHLSSDKAPSQNCPWRPQALLSLRYLDRVSLSGPYRLHVEATEFVVDMYTWAGKFQVLRNLEFSINKVVLVYKWGLN